MKISLLPLLLLALPAVAQYRPMYTAPRPTYTPRPTTSSTSNYNYQNQLRTQQQAHQTFQNMQAQQMQQWQQQMMRNQQLRLGQAPLLRNPQGAQQLEQAQARQQQAEQKATEQLAHLAEQQRQHLANPPADAQQAAAQQKEDARQLTHLTLKNYREVFLPGQLFGALQSLALAPPAQQQLQALNHDLLDNAWWGQQDAAQLPAKITAYSTALTKISTELLGFSPAAVPPVPAQRPARALREQLSQGPVFDQAAAAQLLREAAQAEKRLAGERLAVTVQEFSAVSTGVGASPGASPSAPKQQRNAVKKSLRHVNKELLRYAAQAGSTGPLLQTQQAIMGATASYLAKNEKQAKSTAD